MNKKLLAVAVAGALAAPALAYAQASTVQVYGRVHQAWDSVNQGGLTKDVISNAGGSYIGFKGTEALGGGLNAWFQTEQTLDVSSGANAGGWADRNSAIGLAGSWGSVLLGNWDMPMKGGTVSGIKIEDTGNQGAAALLHGGAPTTVNTRSNIQTFYRRQQNVFQYWTPTFSGFEARVAMTSNEEKVVGATGNPRTWGVAGKYSNGPILVSLGYERHNDALPIAPSKSDTAWTLAGAYTFGAFKISALYERLTWEAATAAAAGDASRNGWGIYGDWNISGPHALRLQYTKVNSTGGCVSSAAGSPCPFIGTAAFTAGTGTSVLVFNGGAGNTGASMWGISYKYTFSKRTAIKLNYAEIRNDALATYGFHITAGTAIPTSTAGQSVRATGLAVEHTF